MKKIFYVFMLFLMAFLLSACAKEDKKSVLDKIDKKVSKSNGYKIEAEMELINNEESYKYDVSVSYKKKNYYRVSLRNKSNNHEQIILKNLEGVYVVTPTLNKSFKFQSKWPYSSSQAYLISSVVSDMKSDTKLSMKKKDGKYVFFSKVNYKNNKNLTHQEIIFDKNLNIKKVIVYDDNENVQIKVDYKTVDLNANFNKSYFDLDENVSLNNEEKLSNVSVLDEAIYPMYLPEGTYLDNEKTVSKDSGARKILTFAGENSFMVVEETVDVLDELEVVPTSGEIDLFANTVAVVNDTSVSFISDGIEYYLVSTTLDKDELLQVAKSITTIPVSK